VLTLSNKSIFVSYNGLDMSSVYFAGHGLAALENYKTGLDDLIQETYGRIAKLVHFSPASYSYSSQVLVVDPDFCSVAAPQVVFERMDRWRYASSQIISGTPDPDTSGWFEPAFQTAGRRYTVHASDGDLIDCRMSMELAGAFYPPGCSAFVTTDCTIVSPFVFLPCFLLLGVLFEYEQLRALVVVAITTLFLRLQSACVSNSIAVCQRNFFTHHGSHPPENRPQCYSGPFSGRVFQPQVVA
jgi:hypothetical protein